ncbi:hypothetical protein RND81_12G045400 [Saponaria officinalis]|uniref:Uncharacterized protein n=1 Tax=Saponaria officinalis TaxID=3572 RepID=A0AAW1H5C4_SAPOF
MQIFDVIRIDKNVVALRSRLNNKFCMRGVYDFAGSPITLLNRLIAQADGLVRDTYLEVVEPVFRRTVTTYDFDLDNARIYNVSLLYSDEHIWDNLTNENQSGSTNGTITTTKSRTFTNNVTVSGTVSTTFVTGVPFIAQGKIMVSLSTSYSREWSETEEETEQVGDTFTVVLLPMKRTIARGVATMGKCDVPFSYVQKDYPTSGGPPIITKLSDGVFTGANAYSFYGEVRYEELPPTNGLGYQAPTKVIKRSTL